MRPDGPFQICTPEEQRQHAKAAALPAADTQDDCTGVHCTTCPACLPKPTHTSLTTSHSDHTTPTQPLLSLRSMPVPPPPLQWYEKWWEVSDWRGMKEMGAEKWGCNAQGEPAPAALAGPQPRAGVQRRQRLPA